MVQFPIKPAFKENNHAFVFESSEEYSPYLSVTLKTLIDHASDSRNYDILILTFNITPQTRTLLINQARGKSNISVRVINCRTYLKNLIRLKEDDYGGAVYMRLCLPELIEGYDIITHIDSDMIINADVADALYEYDLTGYCMAASADIYANIQYAAPYYPHQYFTKEMVRDKLNLNSMEDYINCGFVIYNITELRKNLPLKTLLNYALDDSLVYKDQDAFSHFLSEKILRISLSWNWPTNSDGYIDKYKHFLDCGNKLLKEYYQCKNDIKIYHFVASGAKPWKNPCVPYAEIWWEAACGCPFFDRMFAECNEYTTDTTKLYHKKKGKLVRVAPKERLLFISETYYDLMSALNIKIHYFANAHADIILTSSSPVYKLADKVRNIGVFENVYTTDYNVSRDIHEIRQFKNNDIILNPQKYQYIVNLDEQYSDYFSPCASSPFQKLMFYRISKNGVIPRVHMYEDGMENYIETVTEGIARDALDHNAYPVEQRFISNVVNLYLYKPEAYCANMPIKVMFIPKISHEDTAFTRILNDIFGTGELPEEKYIFFNECFAEELRPSDEIDIINVVAEKVGKENIIIKTHPRAKWAKDIYRINGYKIFPDNDIPWEIILLDNNIKDKVLMTISSNAPLASYLNFNYSVFMIYLDRLMKLSRRAHASQKKYYTFQNRIKELVNDDQKTLFVPNSIDELNLEIDYIEEAR